MRTGRAISSRLAVPRGRRDAARLAGLAGPEVVRMIVSVAVAPMRVTPSVHDREQRVQRADAAGGLDLDVGRGVGAHQPQVVVGRAATARSPWWS